MKDMSRFLIGFPSLIEAAEKMAKMANYPPFNIQKVNDNTFVIEVAVAGFSKSELEVKLENGRLVVSGTSKPDESTYLYKGLAYRPFKREWVLSDNVEVNSTKLINGVLKVWLSAVSTGTKKFDIEEEA